jgi:hypothetical protein
MRSLLLALVAVLPGCMIDRAAEASFREKGYGVYGKDPFRFEVEPQLLREWGGPRSAQFQRVLEEELERKRICRNGYALRNESLREGVFTVQGRCKS